MKLLTENEIYDISMSRGQAVCPISFAKGMEEAQKLLLESASEGFDEWFKDHEINGLCGGVLNYEETMFGSRHISTGDIEHNAKEAWAACSLSHAKKMQEKDAEIEALKKKLEIQTKRVENLKKSNEFYAEELNWQDKTYSCNGVDDPFMDSIKEDTDYSENYICSGGKLARSCQAIDQELEKELGRAK